MLRAAAKLLKVMNSETEPGQISLAFCFGMLAGFTPILSVHNLLVLLLVMVLRVNASGFILALGVFTGVAYLLDPLFHAIGLKALTAGALEGLWTTMYNSTFWRLERFNNTVVMGSLLVSVLLFVPMLILSNVLIRKYREHVLEWVRKTRVMQFIKGTKFYNIYLQVSEVREKLR
jgi:uncharacterized protein (TIGR03546 family)